MTFLTDLLFCYLGLVRLYYLDIGYVVESLRPQMSNLNKFLGRANLSEN